jgi:four helix bundle protein
MEKSENIVKSKSFVFAIRIVRLYQYLGDKKKEFVLSKQCLRSGTSIGALIREAEYAQSKADFVNKLSIAIKEVNEVLYWLELLFQTDYIDKKLFDSLKADAEEILKLLTAIINTTKRNISTKTR